MTHKKSEGIYWLEPVNSKDELIEFPDKIHGPHIFYALDLAKKDNPVHENYIWVYENNKWTDDSVIINSIMDTIMLDYRTNIGFL